LDVLERLFTKKVDIFVVPRLLTNSGPKKAAFVVEIFRVYAAFRFAVEVNVALDV
jgi:hypothetical protein